MSNNQTLYPTSDPNDAPTQFGGYQQPWNAGQSQQAPAQHGQNAWPASQQSQQQHQHYQQQPQQGWATEQHQGWNNQQPYPASNNAAQHAPAASHVYQGHMQQSLNHGPVGKVRDTTTCIILAIVTLGFYQFFWIYGVYSDMKKHRGGAGVGGGLAVLLSFIPFVTYFLTPSTVADMYRSAGRQAPVSGRNRLLVPSALRRTHCVVHSGQQRYQRLLEVAWPAGVSPLISPYLG